MKKIDKVFTNEFCKKILSYLPSFQNFKLSLNEEGEFDGEILYNQPIDSDGWRPTFETEELSVINETLRNEIKDIDEIKMMIQRFDKFKTCKPHHDSYDYTAVLLLNDGFVGGDLIISNTKSELKLGELIYFNSTKVHYIDKVIDGERFSLVCFINLKKKKDSSLI